MENYVKKFKYIFANAKLKKVTCLIMNFPCCSGLPEILTKVIEYCIPLEIVTISNQRKIVSKKKLMFYFYEKIDHGRFFINHFKYISFQGASQKST